MFTLGHVCMYVCACWVGTSRESNPLFVSPYAHTYIIHTKSHTCIQADACFLFSGTWGHEYHIVVPASGFLYVYLYLYHTHENTHMYMYADVPLCVSISEQYKRVYLYHTNEDTHTYIDWRMFPFQWDLRVRISHCRSREWALRCKVNGDTTSHSLERRQHRELYLCVCAYCTFGAR